MERDLEMFKSNLRNDVTIWSAVIFYLDNLSQYFFVILCYLEMGKT